jgi:hypothetical protein
MKEEIEEQEWVSDLWYILPLFFSIIGGLIAFALNFDRDSDKAKDFVIVGTIIFVVELIILAWSFGWIVW